MCRCCHLRDSGAADAAARADAVWVVAGISAVGSVPSAAARANAAGVREAIGGQSVCRGTPRLPLWPGTSARAVSRGTHRLGSRWFLASVLAYAGGEPRGGWQ